MRILFVYANTNPMLYPPPVGLNLVMQNAAKGGHECRMVDFMDEKDPDALLARALEETRPEFVGFSLRNLDNQDMEKSVHYIDDYARWVSMAGKYAPTVIGGSAFSTYPAEMMAAVPATYGFEGQADSTFSDFVREVEEGRSDFSTPGVWWRQGDEIRGNPGILGGYPRSGRLDWSLVDRRKYGAKPFSWAVITKTGCPYECLFCDTPATFGDRFVPREPDGIVEEIRENQRLWRMNRKPYFFVDALFNEPIDWAKALLEKIVRSDLKVGFYTVVEPTTYDRELIRLLVKAGCLMGVGLLMSSDDNVLAQNRKTFRLADISRFLSICREEKFLFSPFFQFGAPGETKASMEGTLDFIDRNRCIVVQAGLGLRIQKQCGLYGLALERGLVSPEDNLLYPKFYFEPGVPLDWAKQRLEAFRKHRKTAWGEWLRIIWRSARLAMRN